jgi:hypothetical protein
MGRSDRLLGLGLYLARSRCVGCVNEGVRYEYASGRCRCYGREADNEFYFPTALQFPLADASCFKVATPTNGNVSAKVSAVLQIRYCHRRNPDYGQHGQKERH